MIINWNLVCLLLLMSVLWSTVYWNLDVYRALVHRNESIPSVPILAVSTVLLHFPT